MLCLITGLCHFTPIQARGLYARGDRGGELLRILGGDCRLVLQILTLLQIKKYVIFHTRFQTRPQEIM